MPDSSLQVIKMTEERGNFPDRKLNLPNRPQLEWVTWTRWGLTLEQGFQVLIHGGDDTEVRKPLPVAVHVRIDLGFAAMRN